MKSEKEEEDSKAHTPLRGRDVPFGMREVYALRFDFRTIRRGV